MKDNASRTHFSLLLLQFRINSPADLKNLSLTPTRKLRWNCSYLLFPLPLLIFTSKARQSSFLQYLGLKRAKMIGSPPELFVSTYSHEQPLSCSRLRQLIMLKSLTLPSWVKMSNYKVLQRIHDLEGQRAT